MSINVDQIYGSQIQTKQFYKMLIVTRFMHFNLQIEKVASYKSIF